MNIFEKAKYSFNKVGYIKTLINEWNPVDCKTEKDYEKSLYNYLHQKLMDYQITKQYAKGRIKADIVVEDKIIIELKIKLISRGNYQRLIGQLSEYKSWEGQIIILLIGETDQHFVKELKKFIVDQEGGIVIDEKYTLIEKSQ